LAGAEHPSRAGNHARQLLSIALSQSMAVGRTGRAFGRSAACPVGIVLCFSATGGAAMPSDNRKPTVEQAAKMIYQVDQPSPKQVGAVAELIARGALEGTRKGHLATTTDAVARYMAAATLSKKASAHQQRQPGQSSRSDMESRALRPV